MKTASQVQIKVAQFHNNIPKKRPGNKESNKNVHNKCFICNFDSRKFSMKVEFFRTFSK